MISTTDKTPRHADLIVVGGGLAGLSAAALVAREGRSVVVLERASHLGGRAATHVRQGIHFNLGPHALYCQGHAFRLFKSWASPSPDASRTPSGGLLFDGDATYAIPSGLGSLLGSRLFTLREKWRLARILSSLKRIDARGLDRIPLRDWIDQTAGAGGLAAFLRTLFRVSTFAADHDRLSAGAAIDQLRLGLDGNVWYLDGGWQTMVDGLRDRAVEAGAEIRTGARAESVRSEEGGVSVRLAGGGVLRGRAAVLAVGPDEVVDLLELPEDEPLVRWASGRSRVRAASLDVALDRLPNPETRVAFGLDRPLYYSVHSASAKLAPEGVAVLHVMKYLGGDPAGPAEGVEGELEALLDRLQPGWRRFVVERRFLPAMTVSHALPRADEGGLAARPAVTVRGTAERLPRRRLGRGPRDARRRLRRQRGGGRRPRARRPRAGRGPPGSEPVACRVLTPSSRSTARASSAWRTACSARWPTPTTCSRRRTCAGAAPTGARWSRRGRISPPSSPTCASTAARRWRLARRRTSAPGSRSRSSSRTRPTRGAGWRRPSRCRWPSWWSWRASRRSSGRPTCLRRVFDHGYDEIAAILGKSEPACRQLVSRAEGRILERRPRFDPDPGEAERLTGAFLQACSTGDLDGLMQLLAPDAVVLSDGGGKAKAALAPILGADRVARFFIGLMKKAPAETEFRRVRVNGQPGLMTILGGQVHNVLTLDIADGRIAACFIVRNPDKLSRVPSR